jgi:hypothetical protein
MRRCNSDYQVHIMECVPYVGWATCSRATMMTHYMFSIKKKEKRKKKKRRHSTDGHQNCAVSERRSQKTVRTRLTSIRMVSSQSPILSRFRALLVFVLAAFCWTKSLLCNVAAFTGMLLYPESTLQLCSSRRFCEVFKDLFQFPVIRPDDVVFRSNAHQSATSARTTRSFRPDAYQCLEASNSWRLHSSGRNGKSSGRSSEFKKIPVVQCIRPDDVVIPSERHSVFDKN